MKYPAYPQYKDSGVAWLGEVPEHWELKRLSYLALLKSGENITSEQIAEGGDYPVYGGNGLRGFYSAYTHEGFYALIGRQGALCGNVNYANGKFWASEHAIVVTPITSFVSKWLGELLRAMNLNQYSVSAAQPGLSVSMIASLKIPVPPCPEQTAIADFLDRETRRIDTLVAKKRKLVELLKEKRSALISRTVTRGLPADVAGEFSLEPHTSFKQSDVEWLGEIPTRWGVTALRYAFQNHDYRRIPIAGVDRADMDKIYPYYGASGVIDYVENFIFDETLILVAEDGANLLSRSTPLAFIASGKYWVNNHAHILKPISGDIRYWVGLLQTFDYTPLITGAAQPKLTADRLGGIVLPKPPEEEQTAIATYLDRETSKIDRLVEKVETAINRLQEYRSALITAAVTGKIDVREYV